MKSTFKVAIIIPAYNESNNILRLIKKINYYLKSTIVIVDDSNNDFTKKILSKTKIKNIIYIKRTKKLGRGSAVIEGFKKIFHNKQFKYFVEMDADLSHNPKELKRNLNTLHEKKIDLLIGSRYLKRSLIINWPLKRRIFSILSIMLTEIILFLSKKKYKIVEVKSIFKNRTKGSSTINIKLILISLYYIIKLFIIKKFNAKLFAL